ncbi:thiol:disulfide interchange protein [Acetobacteraceae bacterium]|nr:thiol:disulfide interchange protein [Acetobacteraceae bacterium]
MHIMSKLYQKLLSLTILSASVLLLPFHSYAKTEIHYDLEPYSVGNPKAPVVVQEWFSLTCTHCAHFALNEFPKIQKQLIDSGKIRYEFHDFPMDKMGLTAAMVAHALPHNRYLPFINAVFSRQMTLFFGYAPSAKQEDEKNVDHSKSPMERLQQEAAFAGIGKDEFDAIANDEKTQQFFLEQVQKDTDKYNIAGTPFFRFNNISFKEDPKTYEKFEDLVKQAR